MLGVTREEFNVDIIDECTAPNMQVRKETNSSFLKYLLLGMLFGFILVKTEVISWFRIQEMFRLQSFHMYGVIGSAIAVGIISVFIIKKFKIRSIDGEEIHFDQK